MGNPNQQSSSSGSPGAGTSAASPSPPPPSYEAVIAAAGQNVTAGQATVRPVPALLRRASADERRPTPASPSSVSSSVPTTPQSAARVTGPMWESLSEEEVRRLKRGTWPHDASSLFACLCCLLGMYNISRFALLVYVYKGYFLFEFVVLTAVLGVPFLYAMMTIGQYVGSGMLDMWYISPAFKGLGYAFLYLYTMMGIYTAVPIAWMFVYFKDSFITTRERYRWALCQPNFAADSCIQAYNNSAPDLVGWTASSYFHARVLDRKSHSDDSSSMGELRFEIAFHLAIIWLLVFVCLCRGLRSLGKVVFILGTFPVALMLLVSIRFMEQWSDTFSEVFSEAGRGILTDSISWLLAAREVFLIWGVLGGAILHLTSHNKLSVSINKSLITVMCLVTGVLICGALLCVSAMQILRDKGLVLVASSFEDESMVKFLQPRMHLRLGVQNATVLNLLTGDCLMSPQLDGASGFQVMRLATEIMPAALAVEGVRSISSFWSICFYGTMILFALGQQVTLWFCVVESIVAFKPKILKAWQTIITFITCNIGFLFGLPMTTNMGIYIVFFLDICVASLWWIVVLFLIMLVAILFIRGQPYGTDQLVTILSSKNRTRVWLLPLLTFEWNVLLPVSYLVISIAFMRWTPLNLDQGLDGPGGYRYWSPWVKRVAFFLQVCPLILSALVCLIKAYLFLAPKSQLPLHERIQAWCCPMFAPASVPVDPTSGTVVGAPGQGTQGVVNGAYEEDPPPKYTPPPSYSTATSRIIIKQLISRPLASIDLESGRRRSRGQSVISVIALPPSGVDVVSYDPEPDGPHHTVIHPGV